MILAKSSLYDVTFVLTLCFELAMNSFPQLTLCKCVESINSKNGVKDTIQFFNLIFFTFSFSSWCVYVCMKRRKKRKRDRKGGGNVNEKGQVWGLLGSPGKLSDQK